MEIQSNKKLISAALQNGCVHGYYTAHHQSVFMKKKFVLHIDEWINVILKNCWVLIIQPSSYRATWPKFFLTMLNKKINCI